MKKTKMITINIPLEMHQLAKENKINMSGISRLAIQIAINQSILLNRKLEEKICQKE